MDLKRYQKSFRYAFKGLAEIWDREQNIKLMTVAAILVIIAGVVFRISNIEFAILILAVSSVLVLETFNTAMEMYIDRIIHRDDEQIGIIKDIMAGAVFMTALFSVVVGLFILGPHVIELISYLF